MKSDVPDLFLDSRGNYRTADWKTHILVLFYKGSRRYVVTHGLWTVGETRSIEVAFETVASAREATSYVPPVEHWR